MGSIPDQFPISLRAWPSKENNVNALPSLISRINFERGDFRNVSEESLREEIRLLEAGGDTGANDSSEDEEEEEQPDRLKVILTAREEMLTRIEQAHFASACALDFVSLLLSKDTPVQASLSISPYLREAVGMGTLGADRLQTPRITTAQKEDNKHIAQGWKVQTINKSVDFILASATRLEKEIESETKYWEQILAVSEKGWSMCKLPQERHTLGVRFGFSESATTFRNRSLAAIRRNPDGSVYLDQGVFGSTPRQLRVRVCTDGIETGQSSLSSAVTEDSPIEHFILQARNSIFAEELWQELNRESRTLASYGIRAQETTITCPITPTKTMILDLVPIDTAITRAAVGDNTLAEGLSLALHILLSYTHRKNYRRRVKPQPPISATKRSTPTYDLLRPIVARLCHQNTLIALNSLLTPLFSTLTSTGLDPLPHYTIGTTRGNTPADLTAAESVISTLFDRFEVTTSLTVAPSLSMIIKSRTSQYLYGGVAGTAHLVSIKQPSLLPETFRPPNTLSTFGEVKDLIYWFVSCSLAAMFAAEGDDETSISSGGKEGWYPTSQMNVLRKSFAGQARSKQLSFEVKDDKLEVRWEWLSGTEEGNSRRKLDKGEGVYQWKGSRIGGMFLGEGIDEVIRGLEHVVEDAGTWKK
ncbi:Mediator of RNA polymerase II transcription subunit 17 [Phlyctema vagabunda]|uniref:Mediator of RNA polymerase II transcription subunit 17 n=1 Tax=Phlyctema vagabunda TaxID=108571 RepID=A0ABR4P6G6_9HELO